MHTITAVSYNTDNIHVMTWQWYEINYCIFHSYRGTTLPRWLRCCATNQKVAGLIPAGVTGIFLSHKILPIALWPWGRLSLEQKWVPGAFPRGKGGRCVRLTTLPPSCAAVMKTGNLNFLEPSGPPKACNGTDLELQNYANSIDIYI